MQVRDRTLTEPWAQPTVPGTALLMLGVPSFAWVSSGCRAGQSAYGHEGTKVQRCCSLGIHGVVAPVQLLCTGATTPCMGCSCPDVCKADRRALLYLCSHLLACFD